MHMLRIRDKNWYTSNQSTGPVPKEIASCVTNISGYHHKTNTVVFTIITTTKCAKFHHSNTIITKVSLFGYVIYFSADVHCISCRINNIAK